MMENLKRILGIPIVLLIICWILFNPYIICDSSPFIVDVANQINIVCGNLNLSYYFSNEDVLRVFRFLEYFVFGIAAISVFRTYFKKIYQNIINSMFLGLLVAVLEVYIRNFGIYKLEVQDILYSFFEFCIGIIIVCVFFTTRPKKQFLLKHKKNNYIGRG